MTGYEEGFRLNDAASECSMRSKARIDLLFEDSRSICSSTYTDWYGSMYEHDEIGAEEQKRANGAVQARIEAMFASVEAETGKKGESATAILSVMYLGAAPVGGRIASVRGLQEPLRQLLERVEEPISAKLEVSRRGLTYRTSEFVEKTNPFRRIAVWSALRLRSRSNQCDTSLTEIHHAFIPLVNDDQTPNGDEKHTELYRTMRGMSMDVSGYPPIFAVVMRRPGVARILECHAFACKTEEDAVAAAATLYRALLADLDCNRRRPRQTNGLGCVSLASATSSAIEYTSIINRNPYNHLPRPPIRPPRTKKNSISSSITDGGSSKFIDMKISRRKKTAEIHAEDMIETRNRQNQLEESRVVWKELCDDSSVVSIAASCRLAKDKTTRNRNEDIINNYRNKLYSERVELKNEKFIGNEKERKINNYEPLSSSKEKLCDSDRNYSFVKCNGSIVGEVVKSAEASLFEKNQNTYDTMKNSKTKVCLNRINAPPASKTEGSLYGSRENSIYSQGSRNSRQQLYEEHFRDADKICSLENVITKSRSIGPSSNEILKCNTNSNHPIPGETLPQYAPENIYLTNRLQRMSRIDEFTQNIVPQVLSDDNIRKRDRAESEPPLSRTEDVIRTVVDVKLKRSQSDVDVERGDLLTRVELPRRGSFLKSTSTRLPNSDVGGTPLGFTELFDEFRNQEGLTSVDDILNAIIDPEGMSFNELKPLYKEFLLKLASTLTQDELYQRSAYIMRRRRRPQRRRSTRKSCLIRRAIKRSVSRFKSGPTEFTSVIFPARKFNESLDSASSYDAHNKKRILSSRLSKKKSLRRRTKTTVTSEDSDTGKRLARSAGANRSSSGYVSCSECSYDSESCTCVSADKCYCSLPRRSSGHNSARTRGACSCDTDSCSESNKCYCSQRPTNIQHPTILEQLRQRGIVPSEGTLSTTAGKPERGKTRGRYPPQNLDACSSPIRSSSDNLALDYDLFSPGRKSTKHMSNGEKVLVVSARDPHGRLVYVGGAERSKKVSSGGASRCGAHHEALSIKKSAEIAAVFGPDSSRTCRRTGSISSMKSSVSLEAGLGYLP